VEEVDKIGLVAEVSEGAYQTLPAVVLREKVAVVRVPMPKMSL
jgi:hypothetical protein